MTVTLDTVRGGIETNPYLIDGLLVVTLGTSKDAEEPQPFVGVDMEDPPILDRASNAVLDAALADLGRSDRETGSLGWLLTHDPEESSDVLLRVRTRGVTPSQASPMGNKGGGVDIKSPGYDDFGNREGSVWSDSLHRLRDRKALAVVTPDNRRDFVIANVSGSIVRILRRDFKLSYTTKSNKKPAFDKSDSLVPAAADMLLWDDRAQRF